MNSKASFWTYLSVLSASVFLLLAYYVQTEVDLSLREWIFSFRLDPVSRPFELKHFLILLAHCALSLLIFAGWMAMFWMGGRFILDRLPGHGLRSAQRELAALGLGMGAVSLLFFFLGIFHLYGSPAVSATASGLLVLGLLSNARGGPPDGARRQAWEPLRLSWKRLHDPGGGFYVLTAALCAGALFFHLLGVLLPPTSFDELNYQLALPKLYVLNGGFVSTPYNHLSFLPKNMGMLFVLGLLSQGAEAAKLFSWGAGVLAALSVYVFGREPLGRRAAFLGSTAFVLIPVVGNQFRLAAADMGTAFYELLGVVLLLKWKEEKSQALLLLSSVFFGLALGCKYTAAPGFLAGFLVFLWVCRQRNMEAGAFLKNLGLLLLPAFVLCSPWLIKNWLDSGNPFNPILSGIFPSRNFFFAGQYLPKVDYALGAGIENYFPIHSMRDLLFLPWNLFVRHNDFNHELGPFFLICLPLFALWRKKEMPAYMKTLLALCALYWGLWLMTPVRMARYFVSGLALTSLAAGFLAAWAVERGFNAETQGRGLLSRLGGWALAGLLLIALTQEFMRVTYIQNVYKKPWGYLFGMCSLSDYLDSVLKNSPYEAYVFANKSFPKNSKVLLWKEFRTFYLERDFLSSTPWDHDYWHELVSLSRDAKDLKRLLFERGITHLMGNDDYLPRQAGRETLDFWTEKDRKKSRLFLEECSRPIFRSEGVWMVQLNECGG